MQNRKCFQRALAAGVILLWALSVRAEETTSALAPAVLSEPARQAIYKGVVGNLLEALPIEPKQRVELQRTNAVVSNTMSARSIALLLGMTNPVVMLGGLIWGIYAASQIKPPQAMEVATKMLPLPVVPRLAAARPAGGEPAPDVVAAAAGVCLDAEQFDLASPAADSAFFIALSAD